VSSYTRINPCGLFLPKVISVFKITLTYRSICTNLYCSSKKNKFWFRWKHQKFTVDEVAFFNFPRQTQLVEMSEETLSMG